MDREKKKGPMNEKIKSALISVVHAPENRTKLARSRESTTFDSSNAFRCGGTHEEVFFFYLC